MKTRFNKIFNSQAGLEATVLRIAIGLILAAHGGQKLFGWFGGYGLEGTGQWMDSIDLAPGYLMALLAGASEFFGGAALMLGLGTRIGAAINALTMAVALLWVHSGNGFFMASNGIEYALALLAATVSLTIMGGGRYAVDSVVAANISGGNQND